MCRSSGRGWIVMPAAPASRQIVAQRSRSGMFSCGRWLRSVATLLTFTESLVSSRDILTRFGRDRVDQFQRATDVSDNHVAKKTLRHRLAEPDLLGDERDGDVRSDARP